MARSPLLFHAPRAPQSQRADRSHGVDRARHPAHLIPVLAILALLLSSCSQGPQILQIWSDVPQMAVVTEWYNRSRSDVRIELTIYENPYAEYLDGLGPPDIIISGDLGGANLGDHFVPLDRVLADEPDRFYQDLLALGSRDGEQLLVPLSFDAPAIMFPRADAPRGIDPFALGDAELRRLGGDFNRVSGGRYRAMGFMPRLDRRFILAQARHDGLSLRGETDLRWDPAALQSSLSDLRDWISRTNGGVDAEQEFRLRYLHDPVRRLMEDVRLLFAFTTVSEFFSSPDRSWLEFRWYMNDHLIHIWGAPVMAGITLDSDMRATAVRVLRELTSMDTQEAILLETERVFSAGFGFLGGLSSLPEANSRLIVQSYRDLEGLIPSPLRWDFGPTLPGNWSGLRDEAVLPVMERYFLDDTDPDTELRAETTRWFRQQAD